MENAIGDELIRRIKAAHPEWDLSFLTEVGADPKALEIDRDDGAAGKKGDEVELELEGGQCDDPWKFKHVIVDVEFYFCF